jgi:hypothetical protein
MRNKYNAKFYEEKPADKTNPSRYEGRVADFNTSAKNEKNNVEFGCEFCECRNPNKK